MKEIWSIRYEDKILNVLQLYLGSVRKWPEGIHVQLTIGGAAPGVPEPEDKPNAAVRNARALQDTFDVPKRLTLPEEWVGFGRFKLNAWIKFVEDKSTSKTVSNFAVLGIMIL